MSQSDVIAAANESARRLGVGAFLYRLDPSPRATKDVTDGGSYLEESHPSGYRDLDTPEEDLCRVVRLPFVFFYVRL